MTETYDIRGMEFDWFAMDLDSQWALFATGGRGFAPTSAIALFEAYDEIFETIETPHWGSTAYWRDYVDVGLFMYEWSERDGVYRRLGVPTSALRPVLKAQLDSLVSSPRFDALFVESEIAAKFRELG